MILTKLFVILLTILLILEMIKYFKNKYNKKTNSVGVDDIQKLPLDWFQNVRENYKKNQIIPRKKDITFGEQTFRDPKKKI